MLRKLKEFEYFEPSNLSEAVSLLDKYGDEAKVLAGGTDLLVWMKEGARSPTYMINIKHIPGVRHIHFNEAEGLRIGALTTVREIETADIIKEKFAGLHQAAKALASIQVRNLATIGGNLSTASPAAELAPPLLALGARVKLRGLRGERVLPLEEFFQGPGSTVIDREILTEVVVPPPAPKSFSLYKSISRRNAVDLAIVGVAVAGRIDGKAGEWKKVKIALGAVAPTPMRALMAEKVLAGKKVDAGAIAEAARTASEEARPISDLRASAWYRKEMVMVLVRRSLEEVSKN
ncbi:MAG: xanthine dehydrogenase family protein subunit M [Desulfobacterales bacterium]|nr:xanthine dehydrogenase family protein subunit M [Desulfobacterales bacterium]